MSSVVREFLMVGDESIEHSVIFMEKDGSCLFHSLSYLIYGTAVLDREVREQVVHHIIGNWLKFGVMTDSGDGNPYQSVMEYEHSMLKMHTYGSIAELSAAAELFNYRFEIFINCALYITVGNADCSVGRLRFTGPLGAGHFDVYVESGKRQRLSLLIDPRLDTEMRSVCDVPQLQQSINSSNSCDSDNIPLCDLQRKLNELNTDDWIFSSTDDDVPLQYLLGSKRQARGRPRTSTLTRVEQMKTNNKKYYSKNQDSVKKNVTMNSLANPDVHRKHVAIYDLSNPRNIRRNKKWTKKQNSAFHYDCQIDYECDKAVLIGKMDTVCTYCSARKWKDEFKGLCCSSGKVHLPVITSPPEPLYSLLTGSHPESAHFKSRIRSYNGAFQMTSFAAKIVREGNFMPSFKVQGQVYHLIGKPYAAVNEEPQFLQIYFVGESTDEAKIRHNNFSDTNVLLLKEIQDMLHTHNAYVRDFKSAKATVQSKEDYRLVIYADKKTNDDVHIGRYNAPKTHEIALVIVGQQFQQRDIVLCTHDSKLQRISELNRAYNSLQYPLMFPRGEDGYSTKIQQQHNSNKTVSCSQLYSHRLMLRINEMNPLHYYGPLFGQFLVDMAAKQESERFNFIRYNQQKLRVEEYSNLKDAMKVDAANVGKLVILPSSVSGSPRFMQEKTLDALCFVRIFGKPDLFITLTCSPDWSEIAESLLPEQKATDRPDIVARVFHLKLNCLKNIIVKGKIFGDIKCFVISQEWQKRGLPHAHCLFWLKNKIKSGDIDKIISAEIPDIQTDPLLYNIVVKTMVHGPCNDLSSKNPCIRNGKCSKNFPKPFVHDTVTGDDGYPKYRRRSPSGGGHKAEKNVGSGNTVVIDNSWIVPYNPVLSRLFLAHCNVEFCNSVKCISYICKYICKGSDQLTFKVVNENDEIEKFQSGRYISMYEAAHKIFRFPIHYRHPPVLHLAVHLENGQRVYFRDGNPITIPAVPPSTTLTAFFNVCSTDSFAATLLYCEIPAYYTWKNNSFRRRKRGMDVAGRSGIKRDDCIGRVYTVHPSNSECFHLRMLLHTVRGPVSFNAIKTVHGVVHPTFQSACVALGLLEDDQQWENTLRECMLTKSADHLRQLFAVLLIFCQVSDPKTLLTTFHEAMTADILLKYQKRYNDYSLKTNPSMLDESLCLIQDLIQSRGKELSHFNIEPPTALLRGQVSKDYLRETSYDINQLNAVIANNEPKLNIEQRRVFSIIMDSISAPSATQSFFLDAPGGTGKTFLINLILAKVRVSGKIALAVASTGIASTLLDGARTAHLTFKLPLDCSFTENPLCNISRSSGTAKLLRECSLIVWDESCMAHKKYIEALNNTLKDIRQNSGLMGSVTVIFAGDFRQVLPVIPRGTRADEVNACLKSSFIWPKLIKLTLTKNMRVHVTGCQHDLNFSNILRSIGDGKFPEDNEGLITLNPQLCRHVTDLHELIAIIYPDIKNIDSKPISFFKERAILTATNGTANEINCDLLKRFSAFEMSYKSVDSAVNSDDALHYPVEFLNSLTPSGMPSHEIRLKVGSPIILLRNLNPPQLCNGTRLQIKDLLRNVIVAEIITGPGSGETVFIPRIPLLSTTDYPFHFRRLQFPVKVCFAMTINKAQGQTFKYTGVDLREDCFSHGQLYVACSRANSANNLIILSPRGKTRNVVYQEIL